MAVKRDSGFTLIEILVVIGIIAILAAVVLIAINPARQFQQARDSQRTSNVNAILNGIGQYIADNRGDLSDDMKTATTTAANISSAGVNICDDLVPIYLPSLPVDPDNGEAVAKSGCGDYDTGYQITRDDFGRITISAPKTEVSTTTISVTR